MRKYPPWLFKVLGMLGLAIGLFLGARTAIFLASAERAPGEVVEIRRIHAGYGRAHRKPTEFPVVRFQDASGRTQEVMAEMGGGFHRWQTGQRVEVGYPPGQPRQARILGFWNQWTGAILSILSGLLLLAWGHARARGARAS
jgi:hypothetical protein